MAYILHIDTSAENSLVALSKDGELLSMEQNTEARKHAATINVNVDAVLSANSISLKDLDAVSVCGGPGSYTGLRIGLATAKGYCYALDMPLMMHSRLKLMVTKHTVDVSPDKHLISVLQAREGEYFIATYNSALHEVVEPKHIFVDDLLAYLKPYQGKALCSGVIDDSINEAVSGLDIEVSNGTDIDILAWCKYAHQEYAADRFTDLANSEPFYLKQVYTHKPKNIS